MRPLERHLQWKDRCTTCNEPILVPETRLRKAIVSVGMKDIRAGNYSVRLGTSMNRHDVYHCFSDFRPLPSSHNSPIFFFYYAELYHFPCKQHRDKEVALA